MDATERILELHELAEPAQIIVGMIRQAERDLARIRTRVENQIRLPDVLDSEIQTKLGIPEDSVEMRSIQVNFEYVRIAKEIIDWALEKIETLQIALQGRVPALFVALSNAKMALLRAKNVLPWSRMETKPLFEALREAQNNLHRTAEELAAIPITDESGKPHGLADPVITQPVRKVGGWTESELLDELDVAGCKISPQTFGRIRGDAKIKPSDSGGAGQQRRYSRAHLRKFIKALKEGARRNRIKIAKVWQTLLEE
ncbi:MAG: hypothetical protein IID41_18200 [Planctomycetes bacterium]|nr:hypothetical protein [Planctomycetota bacterium]